MINSTVGWKKMPDKLRIIKPLEGSITLNQWQKLAKPSLDGIFEEHKGVVMRGSKTTSHMSKVQSYEIK